MLNCYLMLILKAPQTTLPLSFFLCQRYQTQIHFICIRFNISVIAYVLVHTNSAILLLDTFYLQKF